MWKSSIKLAVRRELAHDSSKREHTDKHLMEAYRCFNEIATPSLQEALLEICSEVCAIIHPSISSYWSLDMLAASLVSHVYFGQVTFDHDLVVKYIYYFLNSYGLPKFVCIAPT